MALDDIIKIRSEKRRLMKNLSIDPYPSKVKRTHTIKEALEGFSRLSESETEISLSGRTLSMREHGFLTFGSLRDASGVIQVAFKKDSMGEVNYKMVAERVDIGDFLSATGVLFITKSGERTLDVRSFNIVSKSLRPLPEKWRGLKDIEERYRRRYLDLLMNEEARELLKARGKIIKATRDFFHSRGFEEVETPILQNLAGGASARPFKTRLNAMNMDMYLRVAPELYLKRLLVGGYEKVFEIGRNFRNEGVDHSHNPEFTMLEAYSAYQDYKDGMKFTEDIISYILENAMGGAQVVSDDKEINFSAPYQRITFNEVLMKYVDINYDDYTFSSLIKKAEEKDVIIGRQVASKAEVADLIYKKLCRSRIINPTFIIHHPSEMLPLAKPLASSLKRAGSFQLVIGGWELIKGYSELNDPVVQRSAFQDQEKLKKEGDPEAQSMDVDFLEALEYGMPPAFGIGVGMDRLAAFLGGASSLREIILFPTMKNKE